MENWCFILLQSVITGASELMAKADWQVTAEAYISTFLIQVIIPPVIFILTSLAFQATK
jgi:hypothetical protein